MRSTFSLHLAILSAIKTARELGIDVPEEHQTVTVQQGNRSLGKYVWHTEGLESKQQEPSRALWRLSKGSSGTAGRNGEGVLKVDEFCAIVEEQTGKTEADLEVGDSLEVALPNGRELRVEKIDK